MRLLVGITLLAAGAGRLGAQRAPERPAADSARGAAPARDWPVDSGARVRLRLTGAEPRRSPLSQPPWFLMRPVSYTLGRLPCPECVTGRVAALAPDTLYLRLAPAVSPAGVPRSALRGLDVSRGVSRWRSALWGALDGAVAGAAAAYFLHEAEGLRTRRIHSPGDALLWGAGFGVYLGAAFGGIYAPGEAWRPARP